MAPFSLISLGSFAANSSARIGVICGEQALSSGPGTSEKPASAENLELKKGLAFRFPSPS